MKRRGQAVEPEFIRLLREEAEAAGKRIERAVPGFAGLRVRCRPGRREIAYCWYGTNPAGARMMKSVGEYPMMSIEQAGAALPKVKARAKLGMAGLVVGEKLEPNSTVKDAIERYSQKVLSTWKSGKSRRRVLELHVTSLIGRVKLGELVSDHVEACINKLVGEGKHGQANKVLADLKAALDLAERDGAFPRSPAATLTASDFPKLDVSPSRTRHDLEGLARLWTVLGEEHPDKRARGSRLALRVLLGTARRSGELIQAERTEFDLDAGVWTVPVAHQKMKPKARAKAEPIVVKLPPQVVADLRKLFATSPMSKWAIAAPLDPARHISDTVLARNMREMHQRIAGLGPHVNPHSFRRSFRSIAPEKRLCDPGVAELVLSHKPVGIQATYDVGAYVDQRGEALVAWCNFLDRLTEKAESNVTDISSRTASTGT